MEKSKLNTVSRRRYNSVHVVFHKGTSGPITISVHNIKSSRPNVQTDSVDFVAKVV